MPRIARIFVVLALSAASFVVANGAVASVTSTVISTGDQAYSSGGIAPNDCLTGLFHTCTLRAAITRADNNGGGTIDFDIPGTGVHTIDVGSTGLGALPAITQPVTISGTSQPGWSGAPIIELAGSSAGSSADGLDVEAQACAITGLVINRFSGNGVSVSPGDNDFLITDSYVGTDSSGGGSVPGNGRDGILLASSYNEIGGPSEHAGNVISGNTDQGVEINGSPATDNFVQGNDIGVNATATAAVANGGAGVLAWTADNLIGGTISGDRNVVSGNAGGGVGFSGAGATNNTVEGNYIGTSGTGTGALGNLHDGVFAEGAPNNTIGGADPGTPNVISGNGNWGVDLYGAGATGNLIEGNDIGTNATADAPVANAYDGVDVGTASNTIGGTAAGDGNVISGNSGDGIVLQGTGATDNVVQGNDIGTDPAGTTAIPNGGMGVYVSAPSNSVGGATAGARNIISGNHLDGIFIYQTSGTTVEGNYVGTTASGEGALPNGYDGIYDDGATGTLVGGTDAGAGNLISGNANDGVGVFDGGTITVQGNLIGTDAAGTAALGQTYSGVALFSSGNTVGGTDPADGNVISGNGHWGVSIFAPSNVVQGNFIGTDVSGSATLGNAVNGVYVSQANSNTIGGIAAGAGNRITGSAGDGILVDTGVFNSLRGNLLYSNTPNEIDLQNGGNNSEPAPTLTGAASDATSTGISGTLTASPGVNTYSLDFYSGASCEASGHGPAATYLGSGQVTTKASGVAAFLVTIPVAVAPGSVIVAADTDSLGNTSELSACQQVGAASADLSLQLTDSPDPVPHGSPLTYTATIGDLGLTKATSTVLKDKLPTGVTFVSATASQGFCSGTTVVTCNLGTIKTGKKASVVIVVTPTQPGTIIDKALVSSAVFDPVQTNNSRSTTTTVT